jgi:peptidoglycan L-alanyl-D-glutamate endopeptidase CwlK
MNWSTLFFATLCALCSVTSAQTQTLTGPECLRRAYPDLWTTPTPEQMARNLLSTHTGELFAFDEHKDHLPHATLLNQADLKAQMAQAYTAGFPVAVPALNQDPGRIRSEPFFKALYGSSQEQVRRHLMDVPWAPSGGTLLFNRQHGAAQALERVGQALAEQPELITYVRQPAGSFYWRNIAGTQRKSVHAFGAAVDFALPHGLGRYWQWNGCKEEGSCPFPDAVLNNPLLQKVVEAFEKEGFIWGGKWYHVDSVHFEYRPELAGRVCQRTN